MIALFFVKRLVKTLLTLVMLAALVGGALYVIGQAKKQHLRLPNIGVLTGVSPKSGTHASATGASSHHGGNARTPRPASSGGRCGSISVNAHASCGFATNVMRAYNAHPSATIVAHSPVTGRTYTLHCRTVRATVRCDGGTGDDAEIAFAAAPPATSTDGAVSPAP